MKKVYVTEEAHDALKANIKTVKGGASMKKITVRLIGEDGNVFNIMGKVSAALKRAGMTEKAREYTNKAFAAGSYDEVLQLTMEYVDIE